MTEYWVSGQKYYCKYCSTYVRDDKQGRAKHEGGLKHKTNVAKYLQEANVKREKEEREQEILQRQIRSMQYHADKQYQRDLASFRTREREGLASGRDAIPESNQTGDFAMPSIEEQYAQKAAAMGYDVNDPAAYQQAWAAYYASMAAAAAASAAMAAAMAGEGGPPGEVKDETVKEEQEEEQEEDKTHDEGDKEARHKNKKAKAEASTEEQPHAYTGMGQWQVVEREEDSLYYQEQEEAKRKEEEKEAFLKRKEERDKRLNRGREEALVGLDISDSDEDWDDGSNENAKRKRRTGDEDDAEAVEHAKKIFDKLQNIKKEEHKPPTTEKEVPPTGPITFTMSTAHHTRSHIPHTHHQPHPTTTAETTIKAEPLESTIKKEEKIEIELRVKKEPSEDAVKQEEAEEDDGVKVVFKKKRKPAGAVRNQRKRLADDDDD